MARRLSERPTSKISRHNIRATLIYQIGIDFHCEWERRNTCQSRFHRPCGYAYHRVTAGSGQHPILGFYKSRVISVGPRIGYAFSIGKVQES